MAVGKGTEGMYVCMQVCMTAFMTASLYILHSYSTLLKIVNSFKTYIDVSMYGNAELIFCNIENIHVMRSSANSFADALAMQQNMHANTKV